MNISHNEMQEIIKKAYAPIRIKNLFIKLLAIFLIEGWY